MTAYENPRYPIGCRGFSFVATDDAVGAPNGRPPDNRSCSLRERHFFVVTLFTALQFDTPPAPSVYRTRI